MADTTRAVVNLITSGTLEKYPNVKIIVPHCGSFLPNIVDRLTGITQVLAKQGIGEAVDVKTSMQSFYFDLAGDIYPAGLQILRTLVDDDHILFGGDFPYTSVLQIEQKIHALEEDLSLQEALPKYMYQNAECLFQSNKR